MPNGDRNFHSTIEPKLEAFFSQISQQLIEFAHRHNLKIQKYYHQFPTWDFLFRHPECGIGKIEVEKYTETSIKIWSLRWLDDYDAGIRSGKTVEISELAVNSADLPEKLEEALALILSWKNDDWDERIGGFKEKWQKHLSKAAFDARELEYPVVKF